MQNVMDLISGVTEEDHEFVGTIAFRSESLSLPDGSKVALGIDDGRWVLIIQEATGRGITCFEYNSHDMALFVDKRPGTREDLFRMNRLISYFLKNASVDDLVTILPPRAAI